MHFLTPVNGNDTMRAMRNQLRLSVIYGSIAATLLKAQIVFSAKCGGVKVSDALGNCPGGSDINPIFALAAKFIQFATGLFGLLFVLMIVVAGLQYVVSDGNSDIAREAKDRIRNAVVGFVLFALMFALLRVILPPDVKIFQT